MERKNMKLDVCCVFVVFLLEMLGNGEAQSNCDNVISLTQPCFTTLEERINSALLTSYNRGYVPANSGIGSDYVILASRDVVCSANNVATINCLIGNFTGCPDVVVGPEVFLYTDYITDNLLSTSTAPAICSNFRIKGCEARDRVFASCFGSMEPEFLTGVTPDVTLSRACSPQFRNDMNCMVQSYKECPNVVFQNLQFFETIRTEMFLNNWQNFDDGGQICSCRFKVGCQQSLDNILVQFAFSRRFIAPTHIQEYEKVFNYAETLCGINATVVCAYTSIHPACANTQDAGRLSNYKQYYDFTQAVCPQVLSQEFSTQRQCILDNLSNFLAYCKNIVPEANRNLNCTDMQYFYRCLQVILDDNCGFLSRTIYEMFREYYSLPRCEISSLGAKTFCCNMFVMISGLLLLLLLK